MELLVGGKKSFDKALSCIASSKLKIDIQMFIWRDDKTGNMILEALIKKAEEGLLITIKKDRFGAAFEKAEENKQSMFHKKVNTSVNLMAFMVDKMYKYHKKPRGYKQQPNDRLTYFRTFPNVVIIDEILKDHTKYYMFDDKALLVGGVNIEDKEMEKDIQGRHYKDYMVYIHDLDAVNHFKARLNGLPYDPNKRLEFLLNKHEQEVKKHLSYLIGQTKARLILHMAYFGAKSSTKAILELIDKGIEVVIVTSDHSNIQHDFNRKILNQFYKKGAKIYLHPGLIHAKALMIDETLIVGSVNLNNAAFYKLGECSIILNENDIYRELMTAHEDLLKEATLVTSKHQLKYNKVVSLFEQIVS